MRIFVAVDGTSSSDVVIREAVRRLWPAGSQFAIVQAVDPYFFTNAPKPMEEAKEAAAKTLEQLARPLADAGWEVESQVISANPRHGLDKNRERMACGSADDGLTRERNREPVTIGKHGASGAAACGVRGRNYPDSR